MSLSLDTAAHINWQPGARRGAGGTGSSLPRACSAVMGVRPLHVSVSDDPLLMLLGPSDGDYWSDQGTRGP